MGRRNVFCRAWGAVDFGYGMRGATLTIPPPTLASLLHVYVSISSGDRGYGMRFSGGVSCLEGGKSPKMADRRSIKNEKNKNKTV